MKEAHRSTQRAPLSCTSCAARKTRCSKSIPCQACLNRGTAADCKREVVKVRGRIRTAEMSGSSPSIAEVLLENARLSELVSKSRTTERCVAPAIDLTEYYEKRLHVAISQTCQPRAVASSLDVAFPTQACSHTFVNFADRWTSWVHFGCFFPEFRNAHEQFWMHGGSATSDALWLSVYFAVLASALVSMNDREFELSAAPLESRSKLLWNWFGAVLFYLDQGDFLQKLDIRIVQAIVILGNVVSTMGETHRHANLWSVAIRVAQQLDLGCDHMHLNESLIQQEARRRLWWTLVICEWIAVPLRTPCVTDVDFNCQVPMIISDARLIEANVKSHAIPEREPCPVQYHVIMARIATIYYQLHAKLRLRRWSPEEVANFVILADDHLADVIEHLPRHLRHGGPDPPHSQEGPELELSWIATQSTSLAIVLLYYRLAINRILQIYWLEGSTNFARARSICLSSAVGVIKFAGVSSEIFSRLRSWDFAMIVFSATITLILEVRRPDNSDPKFKEAIAEGMQMLKRVERQNKLAKEAGCILDELRLGQSLVDRSSTQ